MKLTIIVEDNSVYVDGVMKAYAPDPLDLTQCNIPSDVWALQWKETAGWIEFADNPDGTKPNNQNITALPEWALACVGVWEAWSPYVPPVPPESQQPISIGTQTI